MPKRNSSVASSLANPLINIRVTLCTAPLFWLSVPLRFIRDAKVCAFYVISTHNKHSFLPNRLRCWMCVLLRIGLLCAGAHTWLILTSPTSAFRWGKTVPLGIKKIDISMSCRIIQAMALSSLKSLFYELEE